MISVEHAKENHILFFLNRLSLFCHSALTVLFIAVLLHFALVLAGSTSLSFSSIWILLPACALGITELTAAVISNRILDNAGIYKVVPSSSQGELLVKRKFAWMYAPDKLEQWLNEMESQGFTLHSVGRRGRSFYFAKGEEQKQKYCLDYQLMADCKYIASRNQAGWKPLFSTFGSFGKWTIWTKNYSPGQEPQSSCKNAHLTRFALRAAAAYTGVLISMLTLYGAGLAVATDNTYGFDQVGTVLILALFGLIILAMAQSTVQIWLYYRRMKIQAQNL